MANVIKAHDNLGPAADCLTAGGLALVPTETVYGVGVAISAFAANLETPGPDTGYGRIFTLKQRELTQTVPWLVDGPAALERYGKDVPHSICALAEKLWPGALTLVVPAADDVPSFMRAADGTVALRASASPVVQELIARCGSPLAVTSANTHGKPAPISFDEVEPRILAGVDVAVDAGETPCRDASTIVAVRDGELQILREGALAVREIRAVLE
ncbi:MAG: threonylcarbamoyl-AMP synthase [Collinsella intestinalis]|uniref:L-threonylcarbamoyladenylate synthase n=1 Tax=Collinsella intestinalis DSM 13280 TaxID=521003 RepID=C4FBB9_9ACTN|nr:L-threonylcarbamoyladenylate synthase [Collinsella intestinalis]EEP43873.1 Sua5/YciO/YrdC/YwlC family protein [Collinsella intestinalis DSM 13280]MBS6612600.1 threonylcarbamoyl-AMP synthase [Collinsella intestinalis]